MFTLKRATGVGASQLAAIPGRTYEPPNAGGVGGLSGAAPVVSLDERLRDAARREGFEVLPE